MQVSAVKVSFTAAESARMAISTSWSMAKTGSCTSVRWGPVTCAFDRAMATSGAAPRGQTMASGRPVARKWPGRCSSRITESVRVAIPISCE